MGIIGIIVILGALFALDEMAPGESYTPVWILLGIGITMVTIDRVLDIIESRRRR